MWVVMRPIPPLLSPVAPKMKHHQNHQLTHTCSNMTWWFVLCNDANMEKYPAHTYVPKSTFWELKWVILGTTIPLPLSTAQKLSSLLRDKEEDNMSLFEWLTENESHSLDKSIFSFPLLLNFFLKIILLKEIWVFNIMQYSTIEILDFPKTL